MNRTGQQDLDPTAMGREDCGSLRGLVRAAVLLAACATLLPWLEGSRWPVVVPAMSPFAAIVSLTATRTFQATACLGLAVGAIALVRRRWFCRWMCPTGLCAEGPTRLGRRWGRRCPRLPPLGEWLALLTLGGACLGYPLFAWLDPLAIFSGFFNLFAPMSAAAACWSALGVSAVLTLSLLWPGVWCLRLCPLGATQDLLWRSGGLLWSALAGSRVRPTREPGWRLARRAALAIAAGAAWAGTVRALRAAAPRPLRPPGAGEEPGFLGLCIRCGNCVRACPARIVEPDLAPHGIAGLAAPVLHFQNDYCREDCTRCMDACPSGALARLSLDQKRLQPLGLPRVDMGVCLLSDDQECAVCRNRCPYEAIALVFSESDYTVTPQIDPQRCPGCGACEAACPTAPVKAIVVEPCPRLSAAQPPA